jgi:hypothetical protein
LRDGLWQWVFAPQQKEIHQDETDKVGQKISPEHVIFHMPVLESGHGPILQPVEFHSCTHYQQEIKSSTDYPFFSFMVMKKEACSGKTPRCRIVCRPLGSLHENILPDRNLIFPLAPI